MTNRMLVVGKKKESMTVPIISDFGNVVNGSALKGWR